MTQSLEIPPEHARSRHYRFFEILPGALSWFVLCLPLLLSFISVTAAAIFILAYILVYFTRSIAADLRGFFGYKTMREQAKLNWNGLLDEIAAGKTIDQIITRPKWHLSNLERLRNRPSTINPQEIIHAVIIATYNESREVLEPTIRSVLNADYDHKKIIFVLAYEERGGERVEQQANELVAAFGKDFMHAMAVKHPAHIPGEIIGKGANITYAGRTLAKYLEKEHIDPTHVIVTTLDSDNRPSKPYFAAVSYLHSVVPDPLRASYQPLPMFTNNIWDAPAPMRVIATGNTFFYIVLTQRPHLERNFSAHAQSMQALIDMDFWSVRTIVEDGHHFWRSYFHFQGDYRVYPLAVPIFQDAVLTEGYIKTLKAQFIQLRRWTYGASDIAYIADQGFFKKNKVPRGDLIGKFLRTLEGHVTWATGAPLLLYAAFVPALFNPQNYAANQLPIIISRIQTFGLVGLSASLFVALKTLPPRPARYKRHRTLFMLLQWVYLPVTTICYGAVAALYSQTRLMFAKYLSFIVTEKAVKE